MDDCHKRYDIVDRSVYPTMAGVVLVVFLGYKDTIVGQVDKQAREQSGPKQNWKSPSR